MHPAYVDPTDPPSKQAILRAAIKLFAANGVSDTNIRAIARESGYTNPAIFKFFVSKDALALYLFERCYLSLARELRSALAHEQPFAIKLRDMLARLCELAEKQPSEFFFVQDNLRAFWPKMPARSRKTSIIQTVRLLLQQGIREGSVDTRIHIDLLTAVMTGMLLQFLRMRSLGEFRGPTARWVDEIHRLLCKTLAA